MIDNKKEQRSVDKVQITIESWTEHTQWQNLMDASKWWHNETDESLDYGGKHVSDNNNFHDYVNLIGQHTLLAHYY